eukprot:12339352-Alexandrium_andersonii.AAC.1
MGMLAVAQTCVLCHVRRGAPSAFIVALCDAGRGNMMSVAVDRGALIFKSYSELARTLLQQSRGPVVRVLLSRLHVSDMPDPADLGQAVCAARSSWPS